LVAAAVLLLAPLLPSSALAADDPRAERLEQVLLSADKGDWQWALHLARPLGLPQLRAYLSWRELLESRDKPPFAAYRDFLRQGTDWPSLGVLRARAEEAIDEGVPVDERLAFFAGQPPRTRQGRVRYAQALLAVGRSGEAGALLRDSWRRDDFSKGEEGFFLDQFGAALAVGDHAARLDRLLWDGRAEQAGRMLARVGPKEWAVGAARLKLQLSDPGVDAALAAVPASARRDPGLLLDRLRWRRQKGLDAGVREILLDPPAELGRPESWWGEQQRAIRDAVGEGEFKLAYRLASRNGQKAGASFAEAEWLAGWIALRFTRQPELARPHFERIWPAVATPVSRSRAAYWSGRAAAAAGGPEAALAWYQRAAGYPNAFYGQLAAVELGVDPGDRLGPPAAASPAAREALAKRAPARIASLFCQLGQHRHAQPFFRHLGYEAAGRPDELDAVVGLARDCGRADLLLTVTRAAASNGRHLVRDAFPLPRTRAFRERADSAPEPALVLAVARQESLFDPLARSPVGAMGLMQLMPATAQAESRELGVPFSKARLVRDPDYNVRLGSRYLGQQLARHGDEAALALAAYNAGPGRVAQWIEMNGDPRGADPYRMIDWIELIPFAETRNYVQRVLEGRTMYRAILAGPRTPPARTAADGSPAVPRAKPAS
jgi:soluble lytic murein transglycosylase